MTNREIDTGADAPVPTTIDLLPGDQRALRKEWTAP